VLEITTGQVIFLTWPFRLACSFPLCVTGGRPPEEGKPTRLTGSRSTKRELSSRCGQKNTGASGHCRNRILVTEAVNFDGVRTMRRHSNDPVGEDGGPESGTRLVRWAKSYTGDFRFMLDMVLPEASWENGETSPFRRFTGCTAQLHWNRQRTNAL